jgi:predicted patatin/cPLA2 family phospholipase
MPTVAHVNGAVFAGASERVLGTIFHPGRLPPLVETPRRALVVEGGGMRGAYAAGALVELHQFDGLEVDAVWATSSGAASAAYGLAQQPEGLDIWRNHLHGRRLVSAWRLFTGGSALDLDYLVDEVFRRQVPLREERVRARGVPLHVPLTDARTGEGRFFDAARRDPFPILRAAMSLPGAVTQAAPVDGASYVDGGVVHQVPVLPALEAGAEEVTVILTRPEGYRARAVSRLGLALAGRHFPGIRPALRERHVHYEQAMAALAAARRGSRVRVIRPSSPLPVSRWTTRRSRLLAAIDLGRRDARRALR